MDASNDVRRNLNGEGKVVFFEGNYQEYEADHRSKLLARIPTARIASSTSGWLEEKSLNARARRLRASQ